MNGFHKVKKPFTINRNKVLNVYKNDKKDILRITLKNGRILRVTPSHPMSIGGVWTRAEDLKIGSVLDYSLGNYQNTNESVLLPVTDELYNKRSDVRIYKTPNVMSPRLAYLIGAYFANGSFTTNERIKFHCGHLEIHERVQGLWYNLFGIETRIIKCPDRESYVQDFSISMVRTWLLKNGVQKYSESGDMIIPKIIRTSSPESILGFITG